MIIDSHVHMGINEVTGELYSGELISSRMKKYGVDKSIVFSTRIKDATNVEQQNDYVLSESFKYKDILCPYYFFVPSAQGIEYLCRTIDSWNGIKLYPNRKGYFGSPYFDELFSIADSKNLPLIIHTDTRPGVAEETIDALNSKRLMRNPVVFFFFFYLNKKLLKIAAEMDSWFIDSSPWITMISLSEQCLVPEKERIKPLYSKNADAYFEAVYTAIHGRILWGTDIYDEKIQSYEAEVEFYNSLPQTVRDKILENTLPFLNRN